MFSGAPFCLLHLQRSKTSTTFKENLTNLLSKNTKNNTASCKKCGHAKGEARFRASSVVTRSVELNVDIVKGL